MSIAPSDLVTFISASHPANDVNLTGGALLATVRPEFTPFSAPALLVLKSNGPDTRLVEVGYRTAAGTLTFEMVALNGTAEVSAVTPAERVLSVIAQTLSGSRTISLLEGPGGTVRGTIPLNETGFTALFIDSSSAAGAVNRYEKIFFLNSHGTQTLSAAAITLTADPDARILIGLPAAKNDTGTSTNRRTPPAGVSFVDDNISVAVPTGTLAAGEQIGVWVKEGLLPADPAFQSTFVVTLSGSSS